MHNLPKNPLAAAPPFTPPTPPSNSIFEQAGALDKLEGFASFYGADFYHLPRNAQSVTLRKQEWQVPATIGFGEHQLVPLRANEMVKWKLVG